MLDVIIQMFFKKYICLIFYFVASGNVCFPFFIAVFPANGKYESAFFFFYYLNEECSLCQPIP